MNISVIIVNYFSQTDLSFTVSGTEFLGRQITVEIVRQTAFASLSRRKSFQLLRVSCCGTNCIASFHICWTFLMRKYILCNGCNEYQCSCKRLCLVLHAVIASHLHILIRYGGGGQRQTYCIHGFNIVQHIAGCQFST